MRHCGSSLLIFLIVWLVLLFNYAYPSNYFNRTNYYINSDSLERTEGLVGIIEIPNTGYLTCGNSWNYNTGDTKIVFNMLDYSGNIISQKVYGDTGEYYTTGNIVMNDDSTFTVLTGKSSFNHDTAITVLINVNASADTLWTKQISSGKVKTHARKLIKTDNETYAIIGWTGNSQSQLPAFIFLAKVNELGDTLWTKQYGDTTKAQVGTSLLQLDDKGFLLTAWQSEDTFNTYIRDILLIRTDSSGNQLWERHYGAPGLLDDPEKIIGINSNEFLIVGVKAMGPAFNENGNGYYLKIDSLGNIYWEKNHGTIYNEVLYNAIQNNAGYIAMGIGRLSGTIPTYGYLTQISFSGDSLWSRYYSTDTAGGNFDDYFWNFSPVSDGGYIMCGQASPGSTGTQDAWVVKVDSFGCLDTTCLAIMLDVPVLEAKEINPFIIFPNPTSATSILSAVNILKEPNCKIFIYDYRGKLVSLLEHSFFGNPESGIVLPELNRGIYLIRINNGKDTFVLKWIKL